MTTTSICETGIGARYRRGAPESCRQEIGRWPYACGAWDKAAFSGADLVPVICHTHQVWDTVESAGLASLVGAFYGDPTRNKAPRSVLGEWWTP